MTNKIALVDDDQNIITSVSMLLEEEGYEVYSYNDGIAGLEGIFKNNVSLVVLDIKMPRMDGMETLRKIREKSSIPVIFLTSKDEEIDELCGLRMGADDYIKKPFSPNLLIARIKTLLRRSEPVSISSADDEVVYTVGNLSLNKTTHICKLGENEVSLTITEFLILEALIEHPGQVKSRDQLINCAYGSSIYVDDRTIDTHIKRLRRKFKEFDNNFNEIETLYGVGYKYRS
ncbi:MAG: response regulator transcription factor [Alphaproteobacteria bacterium]|nr:response regulator transcription factor [Alphaproteobacteria bacterium]